MCRGIASESATILAGEEGAAGTITVGEELPFI